VKRDQNRKSTEKYEFSVNSYFVSIQLSSLPTMIMYNNNLPLYNNYILTV